MLKTRIDALPYDLQRHIYDVVQNERKPKKILSTALKEDIESYHLLKSILKNYKSIFFTDDKYYLDWVENAIINVLNDNTSLYENISVDLQNIFPTLTNEEIRERLGVGKASISKLWIGTPVQKRIQLFLSSFTFINI